LVEGEGEINDGDVDGIGIDDPLGVVGTVGDMGLDAHGFEHSGEAVDPGVWLPAGARKEQVQAAAWDSGRGGEIGMGVIAHHDGGMYGKGRAGFGCW